MSCLCRYITTPGCICVECARARGFPQVIYANRAKAAALSHCAEPDCGGSMVRDGYCLFHYNRRVRGVA